MHGAMARHLASYAQIHQQHHDADNNQVVYEPRANRGFQYLAFGAYDAGGSAHCYDVVDADHVADSTALILECHDNDVRNAQDVCGSKLQRCKHDVGYGVGTEHEGTDGADDRSNVEVVGTCQISHALCHSYQHGIIAAYVSVGITEQVNHSEAEQQGNGSAYQLLVGLVQHVVDLAAAEAVHGEADEYNQDEWEQARVVQPLEGEACALNAHDVGHGNREGAHERFDAELRHTGNYQPQGNQEVRSPCFQQGHGVLGILLLGILLDFGARETPNFFWHQEACLGCADGSEDGYGSGYQGGKLGTHNLGNRNGNAAEHDGSEQAERNYREYIREGLVLAELHADNADYQPDDDQGTNAHADGGQEGKILLEKAQVGNADGWQYVLDDFRSGVGRSTGCTEWHRGGVKHEAGQGSCHRRRPKADNQRCADGGRSTEAGRTLDEGCEGEAYDNQLDAGILGDAVEHGLDAAHGTGFVQHVHQEDSTEDNQQRINGTQETRNSVGNNVGNIHAPVSQADDGAGSPCHRQGLLGRYVQAYCKNNGEDNRNCCDYS